MPRAFCVRPSTLFASMLALALAGCATEHSAEPAHPPLRQNPEFTYDASGVTHATLTATEQQVNVGNARYVSLVFNGDYDSPLIRTRPGGTMAIRLDNRMDEVTNLHFHGMQVSPLDQGDNIFRFTQPHQVTEYNVKLPLDHSPGPYWYHSHFHGGAQRQVSAGIAGPILVDGMLDPFPELKGIQEKVLVLRNFQKTLTGKVASEIITSAPAIRTINGQEVPIIDIKPGETQLWHFINIAANQYFRIRIDGQSMQVLSRDGNTVTRRVDDDQVLIGPSARFSVLVVGPPAGSHDVTMGDADTGPAGDSYPAAKLAILRSSGERVATRQITSAYPPAEDFSKIAVNKTRQFAFQDSATDPHAFLINGTRFELDRVNTTVKLGDVEEWRLFNPSQELHQFHIHQVDFQVTEINGKTVQFSGYRDNVFIPATGSITLRIPFRDPVILGKFVYHCHILEHEDGGMMQAIQVVRPEDYEQAVKLEPLGGLYGENNQLCSYLRNTGQDPKASSPLIQPLIK